MSHEHPASSTVRVGVLGCGNVGAAVCRILAEHTDDVVIDGGARLRLTRVAVRDLTRHRAWSVPSELLTDDALALVTDPEIDVVVELLGGLTPAFDLVRAALEDGKPVVTANKALIAARGPELFAAAALGGTQLYFEAAVAAAIPLVRTLQLSLAAEPVHRVAGILNGTTNFILSSMEEHGTSYADSLAQAQELGFAEADPTADVSGADAAAKAAIIARLAFGSSLTIDQVYCEGIADIDELAFEVARDLDCVIKLLAIVELSPSDGSLVARVHPALVPRSHVLASVRGAYNAVYLEGGWLGDGMLYGLGAGPTPTASAVVGDVVAAAMGLPAPVRSGGPPPSVDDAFVSRMCVVVSGVYRPGVLATIDGRFARSGVGLASIHVTSYGGETRIVLTTREAPERANRDAVAGLKQLDVVDRVEIALRFFGGETS